MWLTLEGHSGGANEVQSRRLRYDQRTRPPHALQ